MNQERGSFGRRIIGVRMYDAVANALAKVSGREFVAEAVHVPTLGDEICVGGIDRERSDVGTVLARVVIQQSDDTPKGAFTIVVDHLRTESSGDATQLGLACYDKSQEEPHEVTGQHMAGYRVELSPGDIALLGIDAANGLHEIDTATPGDAAELVSAALKTLDHRTGQQS